MATRFEMRETGTGRVLGTVEVEQQLAPGEVVGMFVAGQIQLEFATKTPTEPKPAPAPAAPQGRGRRAAAS